mmetsp:Transcript_14012/g.34538  ORF Transcript_14012/g.34538 Transcript_14012/m.34538 type:complete len:244 (+) Transcript_14012:270-1001(+)
MGPGRQHDDGQLGLAEARPDLPADLEATHIWQGAVQQYEVGRPAVAGQTCEPLAARLCLHVPHVLGAQHALQDQLVDLIVINSKDDGDLAASAPVRARHARRLQRLRARTARRRGQLVVQVLGQIQVAQLAPDARQELGALERLGHVVVGAALQPLHHVVLLRPRGHHDDGHVHLGEHGAQRAQHLVPVHLGHHAVQQHQVRQCVTRLQVAQGFRARLVRDNLVSCGAEHGAHNALVHQVIIH